MRIEEEVFNEVLNFAENEDKILAIYLNRSRTNKNVPKDKYQDYDLVFVVEDILSIIKEDSIYKKFGEILYMQKPDLRRTQKLLKDSKITKIDRYAYLVQYEDGVRIDLTLVTKNEALKSIKMDKLCEILLDKNRILPKINDATDEDYWVKKPSEEEYLDVNNEFWWCTNNIAKALARREIPYLQDMTNFIVRKELEKMLSFKVGIITDFKVSIGKSGKYLHKWVKEDYEKYISTYFGKNVEEAWESIFLMCDLFSEVSIYVSKKLGFKRDEKEARNALNYLRRIREEYKESGKN